VPVKAGMNWPSGVEVLPPWVKPMMPPDDAQLAADEPLATPGSVLLKEAGVTQVSLYGRAA